MPKENRAVKAARRNENASRSAFKAAGYSKSDKDKYDKNKK